MRRWAAVLGWELALAGVALGMVATGRGPLATPPVDPGRWPTWAVAVGPAAAAITVVRVVVLAVVAYLLVVTALAAGAQLWRNAALTAVADVVALPIVRHAVTAGLGLGLSGATLAAGAAAFGPRPAPAPAAVPVLVPLTTTTSSPPPALGAPAPPAPPPSVPVPGSAERPEPPVPETVTVRPGDHLWSIATDLLVQRWHRPVADDEVAPYWRSLVAANRSRLRDPGNADLVYPGDELVVPALPSPSS